MSLCMCPNATLKRGHLPGCEHWFYERIDALEQALRAVREAEWGYGCWPTLEEINDLLGEPDWGKAL